MRRLTSSGIILLISVAAFSLQAAVTITSPTTDWNAILPADPTRQSDYYNDLQAKGNDLDIVGTSSDPGFYIQFWNGGDDISRTDGQLAFRLRISGDTGNAGFGGNAFVGMDLNSDGVLDLFAEGDSGSVQISLAGNGANDSPSTTTIARNPFTTYVSGASNFAWDPVTSTNDPGLTGTDIDADNGNDYFVSYLVPFADIVAAAASILPSGITYDDSMPIAYIAVTGTQNNALNSDFNALQKSETSSTTSWADLGAISESLNTDGTPVPEPSTYALVLGLFVLIGVIQRRRK